MAERILAIDPGERVGWAHGTAHADPCMGGSGHCNQVLELTGHGITPLKDFAVKLAEVAGSYDTIVYEPYRIAATKLKMHVNSDVPTLQFVGMVRLCGWLNPKVKMVSSPPARKSTGRKVAAALFPEIASKIEEALASHHDSGHDGDALMHLVAYYHEVYV